MDNLIPVGISLLSSCLKKAGHDVKLFDTTFYRTSEKTGDQARIDTLQIKETKMDDIKSKNNVCEDFRNLVESYRPDVIGFSVVESTEYIFRLLLSSLSLVKHKAILVAGGIYPTTAPEIVLAMVDIVCIGEGEEAIVELANRIDNKQNFEDIQNLWIKKEDRCIIKNTLRPLIDLDRLPIQDWMIYEKERLYKPMGGKLRISGPIELQRGCFQRCAFCCNAFLQDLYKGCSKYPRQKSINNFIAELEEKILKFDINYLYLVAENFLSMKQKDFDDFIKQYKNFSLPFWIETRPETISKNRIEQLKQVGCEGISIGVEHGNEQFRREILNRYVSNQIIINAFKIVKESGIRVCANNIIGFPTETRELIFDTIELNRKLQADNVIVNIFCPYRGTRLFDLCVGKGYINKYHVSGDYRGIDAGLDMPQLSKNEILGLQRTFPLYVKFDKYQWNDIHRAETNDNIFKVLSEQYKINNF